MTCYPGSHGAPAGFLERSGMDVFMNGAANTIGCRQTFSSFPRLGARSRPSPPLINACLPGRILTARSLMKRNETRKGCAVIGVSGSLAPGPPMAGRTDR